MREKDFGKIEVKNNICINVFGYENRLVFSIFVSDQKFENSIDLLLITGGNKSHYVYIKDFNRFMFLDTKNKNKKHFCKSCLQCFSSEVVLTKHKEDCLSINGATLTIKLKSYFKQIPVPFKNYADFECNLRNVEICKLSYSKKYQKYIPCRFAYTVVDIDDKYSKPIVVFRGKNAAYQLIKAILEEYGYCKK